MYTEIAAELLLYGKFELMDRRPIFCKYIYTQIFLRDFTTDLNLTDYIPKLGY